MPTFTYQYCIKTPEVFRFRGRSYTSGELAKLSGAPDKTTFTFRNLHDRVIISGENPQIFEAGKPIVRAAISTESGLSVMNMQLHVKQEFQRSGIGVKMLMAQLKACRELNVHSIGCLAARYGKDKNGALEELDGYMVWPKLGFDGEIPDKVRDKLGPDFLQCMTVQELLLLDGGLAEWKMHGDTCRLTFEVNSGSVHSEAFAAYCQRKGFTS